MECFFLALWVVKLSVRLMMAFYGLDVLNGVKGKFIGAMRVKSDYLLIELFV